MLKNKANEVMVRFLIAKGTIIREEGYYSDDRDYEETERARGDVDGYLKKLDWNKTEAPKTHNEPVFNGTFADDSYVDYLKCELYFKTSKKNAEPVLWKLELRDMNFEDLINMVFEFAEEQDD